MATTAIVGLAHGAITAWNCLYVARVNEALHFTRTPTIRIQTLPIWALCPDLHFAQFDEWRFGSGYSFNQAWTSDINYKSVRFFHLPIDWNCHCVDNLSEC